MTAPAVPTAVAPSVRVIMATYGAMHALLSDAGVIAAERAASWSAVLVALGATAACAYRGGAQRLAVAGPT